MLEKKEKVLEKKAAAELERAKEFSKAKNKRGMINHNSAIWNVYLCSGSMIGDYMLLLSNLNLLGAHAALQAYPSYFVYLCI